MDVREHTARGDGDACKELVELLVVAHGDLLLQVTTIILLTTISDTLIDF